MRCKYTFLGKRRRREGRKKKKRGERMVRKKGRGEREREKGEGKREIPHFDSCLIIYLHAYLNPLEISQE